VWSRYRLVMGARRSQLGDARFLTRDTKTGAVWCAQPKTTETRTHAQREAATAARWAGSTDTGCGCGGHIEEVGDESRRKVPDDDVDVTR